MSLNKRPGDLSGFQKRSKQKEKLTALEKGKGGLDKFIIKRPRLNSLETNNDNVDQSHILENQSHICDINVIANVSSASLQIEEEHMDSIHEIDSKIISSIDNDPGKWPEKIDQGNRCFLIQRGPTKVQGSKDISGTELANELTQLKAMLPPGCSPKMVLKYIHKNHYEEIFINTSIALRVLLTLPVTVASGERSFSCLKLIKTYLRSTMAEERLNDLAQISIESQIANSVDYQDIITTFAEKVPKNIVLRTYRYCHLPKFSK